MKKLVIALGGNALGNSPKEQLQLVRNTAKTIADLVEEGYAIVISHGNGPQVGIINLAFEYASNNGAKTPEMPFAECGAMSQGYIGYHLQQSIREELKSRGIRKEVVSVVTEVLVDKNDQAFTNLSKPIGMFYSKDEAEAIAKEKGFTFIEDSGRGYRRVVASPKPQEIIGLKTIETLLAAGSIVITVGGGGIPVIQDDLDGLKGVDAVIDKDKSSAKLAEDLNAKTLIILTAVEQVYLNFNKPNQKQLDIVTLCEAQHYINEGHFAKGSMLPKIQACMGFVQSAPQGTALITSLEKAKIALQGKTGTVLKK